MTRAETKKEMLTPDVANETSGKRVSWEDENVCKLGCWGRPLWYSDVRAKDLVRTKILFDGKIYLAELGTRFSFSNCILFPMKCCVLQMLVRVRTRATLFSLIR